MARALAGGILAAKKMAASDVAIVDVDEKSRAWWNDHHPDASVYDSLEACCSDETRTNAAILLAVKPGVVPRVLSKPGIDWSKHLTISIAAGVTMETIGDTVGHRRIVRVMPNTPALVGQGASGYCVDDDVTDDEAAWVGELLASVGMAVQVSESQINAVTAVSGSGPAYIYTMIEAMADGGVAAGLPRAIALQLATQTALGAASMVSESQTHPAELRDRVCSPAGTTIAAVAALEQNGFRGSVIAAVLAAHQRGEELS